MKKIAFGILIACGFLFACTGKKSETKDNKATTEKATADTAIIDYGTVTVDSISPDSVQVNVADTAVEIVAEPEKSKKKSK